MNRPYDPNWRRFYKARKQPLSILISMGSTTAYGTDWDLVAAAVRDNIQYNRLVSALFQ